MDKTVENIVQFEMRKVNTYTYLYSFGRISKNDFERRSKMSAFKNYGDFK